MKLISHRGNISGPLIEFENSPEYIERAINMRFDVEIDVWFVNNKIFSGHDQATYHITIDWLLNLSEYLWIHCKNLESLFHLKKFQHLNYFWHQDDDVTITSMGQIWTYPGKILSQYSIAVLPEIRYVGDLSSVYGICSDYIYSYTNLNKHNS